MDLSTALMGVAVLFMAGALYKQHLAEKQMEQNRKEVGETERHNVDAETVRALRVLRTCGFPAVVNPTIESHKDPATRNLWYFKAAMKIKDHDMDWFSPEQYEKIKWIMPIDIPSTISKESCNEYGLDFEIMRDILPLAAMLYSHIEGMTQEVFGNAETVN